MRARTFKRKPLVVAISTLSAPLLCVAVPTKAQEMEEIVVTATRRTESVQDIPINIAAISEAQIEEVGITDLAEIARWIPGVHIVDQGARSSDQIIVRGLNADPIGASEGLGNDSGGTVATYIGEIPLYVDLKMNDMERVEALLGPQGTLYGAGTMTGAIRYIPRKPEFDANTFAIRGESFQNDVSSEFGTDTGFTVNIPLGDQLALRGSLDYLDDPGFIDYNYLVRTVGVSDPEPDLNDPAAIRNNLRTKKDANFEQTLSGRLSLRWAPSDVLDGTLTYYYQDQEVGARTINSARAFGTGKYVSGKRVLEPNERENQLLALELTADLGFAELTSATGVSNYKEHGQRDQTDLLITLEYSYEAFPAFTSFTAETQEDDRYNQEIRLVSTNDSPHSWIVGVFYNKLESDATSKEFTPGYDIFAVNNFGGAGPRPDSLEYFAVDKVSQEEQAIFGEYSYQISDQWEVTIGGRYYSYDLETDSAVDFPLFNTVFDGAAPDAITLDFQSDSLDDSGDLFKFNLAYQVNEDILTYFTISEGYRFGAKNGVAPCPVPLPPNQIACALPDELIYTPDTTTNYELGVHSQWLDNRLTLNGAVYFIEWDNPQLASSTLNANIPITKNGEGAEATGVELSFNYFITDSFNLKGSYSYNKAELSEDAPDLLRSFVPPGFNSTSEFVDGLSGDRLPGSPEHQGTLIATYDTSLSDGYDLTLNYSISAISDVLTKTGGKAGGEALPGYGVQRASITLSRDSWTASLFANNLDNRYIETGVISNTSSLQQAVDINGDPVTVRSYAKNVLAPRTIGLKFTYNWE